MAVFIIGAAYALRPDWKDVVDAPKPGNRKPETYQAALPGMWAELEAKYTESGRNLAAHQPAAIALAEVGGKQLEVFTPLKAVEFLASQGPGNEVVGIHATFALLSLGWHAVQSDVPTLPPWWWNTSHTRVPGAGFEVVDPFWISGAGDRGISEEATLRAMNMADLVPMLATLADKETEAKNRAQLASHLAQVMGIL